MKKLFVFIIISSIAVFPQEMRKVLAQSYSSLSSVSFVDQNIGWMTGSYEGVYKTTNAGISWEKVNYVLGAPVTYYANQFFSATTGYIAGGTSTKSVLKKTTDGGVTWTELTFPTAYSIKDISFNDEQTGWALASTDDTASVYKTVDGGANWTQVLFDPIGDLEALDMLPNGRGIAAGGRVGAMSLWYTADGTTWTKAPVPPLGGFSYTRIDIHDVDVVNDNMMYAVGWGSSIGMQPSILLKSTNGGASWTYMTQAVENRTYQNLNAVYFKDENNGIALGGGAYEGTIGLKTTDGGVNWIPQATNLGFTVYSCAATSDAIYFVGGEGNVGKTTDMGTTCTLLTPTPGGSLRAINIINNVVYATGFNGVFFKSTDKGNHWRGSYAASGKICTNVNSMSFINENIGFLARSYRHITKTTDGGTSWSNIMNDTNVVGMQNEGIYFFDENNGVVAGRSASNVDIIYKTTNSGLEWSSVGLLANENLNSVTFSGANNGVIAGNDNKMLYTTNGGVNWTIATHDIPSGTEVEMKTAAFLTPTKVIAVGEKAYLISEDAGATWKFKTITGLTSTLEGVAFKSATEGIAVGGKFIFKTTDGGDTWTNINDTLVTGNNSFYDVAYDQEGNYWIAGGSSEIFTNYVFTDVNDIVNVPTQFTLSQNYPNPFNPSTIIKFSVASEVKVSLRVYDILGNLVTELLNENKPAGEYQVEFNASKLSSGIYFCVMNAGEKLFTTKMSLIK
ncbi:MAG: YCF48-related protein [Syntrophothermus sp.]